MRGVATLVQPTDKDTFVKIGEGSQNDEDDDKFCKATVVDDDDNNDNSVAPTTTEAMEKIEKIMNKVKYTAFGKVKRRFQNKN